MLDSSQLDYGDAALYLPIIQKYSYLGIDPALVLGHMQQESSFNPRTYRSEPQIDDASIGLLQLLLATANRYEKVTQQQLYDPETNIRIAMKYMRDNLDDYGGDIQDAIAAYNSGSVFQADDGTYTNSQGDPEVQTYVDNVYSYYVAFANWMGTPVVTGIDDPTIDTSTASVDVSTGDPTTVMTAAGVLGIGLFIGLGFAFTKGRKK
jgi:soluble lytic murein transglycosylase-like protein